MSASVGLTDSAPTAVPSAAAELDTPALRAALRDGREAIREEFRKRGAPRAMLAAHRRLVDGLLRRLWDALPATSRAALAAVGGYGRGELFPHSDVDVLILVEEGAPAAVLSGIEGLIGLLWDVGLEVGHSVRTVRECVELAAGDVSIQTNLLEARWLAGDRGLFERFAQAYRAALDPRAFCKAKLLEQRQRHDRYQDTNLEPNLKEFPGGLRDLHQLLWISRAGGLGGSWAEMVGSGLVTQAEARQLARLHRLVNDLRIRLHYLAKRREDRLLFDYQTALANELGIAAQKDRRASELLMQKVYRAATAIRQINTIVQQNVGASLFPPRVERAERINDRFLVRHELLEAVTEDLFEREPTAILESFHLLQIRPELKGMRAGTLRALWRARRRINPGFRRDPRNRDLFMRILRAPSRLVRELRRMNQYGILGRYIPEFGAVVGQMQHDLYHVYTVDEHIFKVVRNLRRFTVPELAHEYPLCSRLIRDFARPEVLYLAGLFHDIAKGRGGDHSELGEADARRFCEQHDVPPDDVELVSWLVRHHLFMSSTAQKQDVSDPDVVRSFATFAGDDRHLVALYLLTVADIRGTSPKVWNGWKARLLEQLFWAARRTIAGEPISTESSIQKRQVDAIAELRLNAIPENAEARLWRKLDDSYFLRHDASEIAWHARLLNYRVDTPSPVVKARMAPMGEGLQVMIYTPDQPELFARICNFFARTGLEVVDAKIHTTRHGYALDSFLILDPQGRETGYRDLTSYIEHELTDRIARRAQLQPPPTGRLSRRVRHFPVSPEVDLQPDERGSYKVLSIIASDQPGLLDRIARVLVAYDVDLHAARISTLGERAEDTFLITGAALSQPRTVLRLESDLLQTLQL